MSFKIPCGGFRLDEESFSLDKEGTLSMSKPIGYDFMPEGYPRVEEKEVVLLEETEFEMAGDDKSVQGQIVGASLKAELKVGEIYTIYFDGIGYECEALAVFDNSAIAFGNPGALPEASGNGNPNAPFAIVIGDNGAFILIIAAPDYAGTHTLSITQIQPEVIPISYDYMPEGYPKVAMEDEVILGETEFEIKNPSVNTYVGNIEASCKLEHGEIYTIYYDGIGYECEAWDSGGTIVAGNLDGVTGGSSTPPSNSNAPFRITPNLNDISVRTFTPDSVGFHTLSITHHKREVTRMSPEFLPEGGGLVVEIDWDNNTVITPLDAITEAWLKHIPMVIYNEGDGYCSCYYFSYASGYYGKFQSAEFTTMYRDYNNSQAMRVDFLIISSDGSVDIENYRFEHDDAGAS